MEAIYNSCYTGATGPCKKSKDTYSSLQASLTATGTHIPYGITQHMGSACHPAEVTFPTLPHGTMVQLITGADNRHITINVNDLLTYDRVLFRLSG